MSKKDTVNSGIATLDAANLTYNLSRMQENVTINELWLTVFGIL